jgi:hypothetical protein
MQLSLLGEVLAIRLTRGGKAQRVIIADGQERNAVVIAPLGFEILPGQLKVPLKVRAQVQTTKEGTPTNSVVYMLTEGWPARESREPGQ